MKLKTNTSLLVLYVCYWPGLEDRSSGPGIVSRSLSRGESASLSSKHGCAKEAKFYEPKRNGRKVHLRDKFEDENFTLKHTGQGFCPWPTRGRTQTGRSFLVPGGDVLVEREALRVYRRERKAWVVKAIEAVGSQSERRRRRLWLPIADSWRKQSHTIYHGRFTLLGFGEYFERRRLCSVAESAAVRSFNVLLLLIIINTREYATFLTLPILFSFLLLLPHSSPTVSTQPAASRRSTCAVTMALRSSPRARFKTYSNEYLATRYTRS